MHADIIRQRRVLLLHVRRARAGSAIGEPHRGDELARSDRGREDALEEVVDLHDPIRSTTRTSPVREGAFSAPRVTVRQLEKCPETLGGGG